MVSTKWEVEDTMINCGIALAVLLPTPTSHRMLKSVWAAIQDCERNRIYT
jgi:hypothetical protein